MLKNVSSRRQFLQAGAVSLLGGNFLNRSWAQVPQDDPLPARQPLDRLAGPPLVSARSWAIAEGQTGRFLWGANEATALTMASTTKIMTAWTVLQFQAQNAKTLEEIVTVSAQAAKVGGSTAQIRTGDRLSVRDLLYGLLLPSGNDAAFAFAEHFGSRCRPAKESPSAAAAFVGEMNRQAGRLRLGETQYIDPHGLGRNQTSARDLATLCWHGLQNSLFRQYVQTRRHRSEITDAKGHKRPMTWNNTNKLLDIEGYDGVKTGTTTAAGYCLASSGRRMNDHLIVVVLGCTSNDSRYIDTRNLYRWAWRERGHKES
jgi:D-alanyl-D-alanine carboxypeptidase (penicillin-binding protein 5/6)